MTKEFSPAQIQALLAARDGRLRRYLFGGHLSPSYAIVRPTEGDYGDRYLSVRRPTIDSLVRSGHLNKDLTLTEAGLGVVGR